MKLKGARTIKGLRGNLRFILLYKFWAATILFLSGLLLGFVLWGSTAALSHEVKPAHEVIERLDHIIHLMETFEDESDSTRAQACNTLSERVRACSKRGCSMTFMQLYAETCGGKK